MKGIRVSGIEEKGWKRDGKIDLVNNKKEATCVNIAGIVMIVIMCIAIPFFFTGGSILSYLEGAGFIQPIVLVVAIVVYIPLHEIVHGVVLKLFTDEKLSFGWKFVYAYCGSKEAMMKPYEYFAVALAPAVVFTIVFVPLCLLMPSWGLMWYFMEMMNISGSVGDFYVTLKIWGRRKENILISDSGTDMTIWKKY
ncbi:MAG: DUF3267 domain-containing protein [Candidatus Ornithospirochaeta sp.]